MKVNKFRAWDDKNMKMYSAVDIHESTQGLWYEEDTFGRLNINLILDSYGARQKLITQQFTGKLDINKKEIYEGDIVEYQEGIELGDFTPRIGVIKFCDGCFAYGAADTLNGDVMAYFIENVYRGWKVIGNIFQHTNLLGSSK